MTAPSVRRAPLAALALLALAALLPGCGGGGASPEPQCRAASDCTAPAASTCLVAACSGGTCGTAPAAAGTALPDPTPGDCRGLRCDGAGHAVAAPDDADLPAPVGPCVALTCAGGNVEQAIQAGTPCPGGFCDGSGACVACLVAEHCGPAPTCSVALCNGGLCVTAFESAGAACGSGLVCDGAGACVGGCGQASDCAPTGLDCVAPVCAAGQCLTTNLPAGTVAATQQAGDCRSLVCDGGGATMSVPDSGDLPLDDGNPCTAEVCSAGTPSHPPLPAGTTCPSGVCDGTGSCVQCRSGADCPSGVCTAGACAAATCQDQVKNGAETDVDCGGHCLACGTGMRCAVGADCQGKVCAGAVCAAPSCNDLVQNGDETGVDCGGSCPACPVNGCSDATALDLTGLASATVTFPGAGFAYSPACLKVRAGTVVTFSGTGISPFLSHPLQGGTVTGSGLGAAFTPAASGPFAVITNAGSTASFTMSAPGTYPYACVAHYGAGMMGAVFVVP